MLAVGLSLRIDRGVANVQFDPSFKQLTGIDDLAFEVTEVLKDINLEQYLIEIQYYSSGSTTFDYSGPTIFIGLDLEERGDELAIPGPDVDVNNLGILLLLTLEYGYPRAPFFETAMRRENGRIVAPSMMIRTDLSANPDIGEFWLAYAALILVLGGPIGVVSALVIRHKIREAVKDYIEEAEEVLAAAFNSIGRYFYDVIMHLAERDHVMFRLTADDESLIVWHHAKPGPLDFLDPAFADVVEDVGVAPEANIPSPATSPSLGPRPRKEVRSRLDAKATSIANSSKIAHIVLLMLENRSFDHMLGYRGLANDGVNGLSGDESNTLTLGNPPYPVHQLPRSYGLVSPDHGFGATLEQIADGRMNGFVENYSRRAGVTDPGTVMGYYTDADLPMYDFLANNYALCDNWHSAHPGETQCNRFATITGRTPELENLSLDDPRVAYFKGTTIFDHLSRMGVDWVFAEGNVGFLRMFDRYRIDVRNVIPFRDDFSQGINDTFEARVRDGRLPSVSFIDPRYIDVPPVWDANDDLPPADVHRGQDLVRSVYRMLSEAPTWPQTLLIITYDEHGGFFDHSPPAGFPGSAHPGSFPRIHPEGVEHLGVRVPALIVSPMVDAGSIIHTVFDHTSVIKTVLELFAPSNFPIAEAFGERAASAEGLLSALRKTARIDRPTIPDFNFDPAPGPRGPTLESTGDDFRISMRLLGVPADLRNRLGQ